LVEELKIKEKQNVETEAEVAICGSILVWVGTIQLLVFVAKEN
jgi:hypothetical protein